MHLNIREVPLVGNRKSALNHIIFPFFFLFFFDFQRPSKCRSHITVPLHIFFSFFAALPVFFLQFLFTVHLFKSPRRFEFIRFVTVQIGDYIFFLKTNKRSCRLRSVFVIYYLFISIYEFLFSEIKVILFTMCFVNFIGI